MNTRYSATFVLILNKELQVCAEMSVVSVWPSSVEAKHGENEVAIEQACVFVTKAIEAPQSKPRHTRVPSCLRQLRAELGERRDGTCLRPLDELTLLTRRYAANISSAS